MRTPIFPSRQLAKGFSLVEVMVSLIILSIGLLAIARIELELLSKNNGSFYRGQVAIAATDLMDRVHANKDPTIADQYLLPDPAVPPTSPGFDCRTASCTTTNMAKADLYQWYTQTKAIVPGLKVKIVNAGTPPVKAITIMWNEPGQPATATGTSCTGDFKTSLFCYTLGALP